MNSIFFYKEKKHTKNRRHFQKGSWPGSDVTLVMDENLVEKLLVRTLHLRISETRFWGWFGGRDPEPGEGMMVKGARGDLLEQMTWGKYVE